MKSFALKGLILASIFGLLAISCDGGGSNHAGGGIDGTGIMSAGVVSAFGSIEVNGTDFDTTNAEVIINGEFVGVGDEFVEDNLEVGMVVTVEGRVFDDDSAVADRVVYAGNVVGPVANRSAVDPDTGEIILEILGQTVVVNLITKFIGTAYDTVDVNDVIVVSGYRNFDGSVRATFIEKTDDFAGGRLAVEVTGLITDLRTNNLTFEINDLTVNYADIADDLPRGFPANGLLVEVTGTIDRLDGDLDAEEIEPVDESIGDDVEEIEIMGYVTEVISDGSIIRFRIGNQEVRANADPRVVEYVDGEPDDIAPGRRLEAEGDLEGGVLIAWEIEFWKPDQIEVEGVVEQLDFINRFPQFTFEERGDQLFKTNNETEFEDIDKFDIEIGIELEVKGVPLDIDHSEVAADKVSFEEDD